MRDPEPFELDRALKAAARDVERSPSANDSATFSLPAQLTDEETLAWLRDARGKEPLAEPLERWLLRVREQAECAPRRAELRRALFMTVHPVTEPEQGLRTLADLLRSALSRPAERAPLLRSFFGASAPLSELVLRLWDERQRFAEGVGVSLDSFEVASPAILPAARQFLVRTQDAYDTLEVRDENRLLGIALARDAHDGWPARLTPRTLSAFLAEPEWFEGLRIGPLSLPEAFGAASFVRALGTLGRALSDASNARRSPFVLARDVFDEQRESTGALLSGLPLSPAFATRRLGLGSAAVPDHVRSLTQAALVNARVAAFRVLLRELLLAGPSKLRQSFGETSEAALGFELPIHVAGAFLRARPRDSQRFAGILQASVRARSLLERHDQDWFRNPRAIRELRAELAEPVSQPLDEQALNAGTEAFASLLETL